MRRNLVGFAAVLRSDLHDYFVQEHGVACGLGFFEDISHRLLDIGVLAGIGRHFQQRRMRVVGRGENYGVNLLVGERVFDVLKCARRAVVVLGVGSNSFKALANWDKWVSSCSLGEVTKRRASANERVWIRAVSATRKHARANSG